MRGKSRAGQRASQRSSARASSGRTSRSAKRTTDHDEIREWAESRGGHPATVKQTRRQGQPAGVIRIDFPGFSGQATLKEITWKEWFDIFEKRKLAFLYQNLKNSRFNKLVERED